MIHGTKFWNKRGTFYIQSNNPLEQLLKKRKRKDSWLESCGPSAACSCISSLGCDLTIRCPGSYKPQPEETLMDFFNDPINYDAFEKIRAGVIATYPGNRIPQFYPYAVYEVFGVLSQFRWGFTFDDVAKYVTGGNPVQICLKSPGHYIAVVAYNDDKKHLIYNDSWPGRFKDKNGFNRSMDYKEFSKNVQNYFIVYGV
jgi:hypothetical protein